MATGVQERLLKTNLFEAGEDGFVLYRNPGIAVSGSGAVLVFCEAREAPPPGEGSDWAPSAIVLRRSLDDGETWEAKRVIARNERGPAHNPTPIRDLHDPDTIHFLYQLDYATCWYVRSTDNGATFSEPREITPVFERFRSDYDWKVIATGIGHGIQLRSGRLLTPVWLSTGEYGGRHRPSRVSVIYSDDGGATWERGELLGDSLSNPSETQALELADGRVLLNIRNESPERRRAYAVSGDGAAGWTTPAFDDGLYEPVCCASIVRYSGGVSAAPGERSRVLFCNPDAVVKDEQTRMNNRRNLTVRLSYDDCRSWPVARVLEPEISGYSDLAVGADGSVLCAYNRFSQDGRPFYKRYVCFARFNLAWLTAGEEAER